MVSTGARIWDVFFLVYFRAYVRACNNFECINLVQIMIKDSLREAEEVAQQLKALAEDPSSVPQHHIECLTTTCKPAA